MNRRLNEETIKFTYERCVDKDGNEIPWEPGLETEEVTVELPTRFEVCDRCEGRGKHMNPAIDGHGITEDEWNGPDWDDESRETYLSGGYDITCEECKGLRVVPVVDEDRCDKALFAKYQEHVMDQARDDAEDRAIRRMEMGYLE